MSGRTANCGAYFEVLGDLQVIPVFSGAFILCPGLLILLSSEYMTMDKPLSAGCCSTSLVVARRRRPAKRSGTDGVGRSVLCRGHGLLAVLLMADRSRVVDAFAGLAVGASAMRVGSTSSEGLYRSEAGGLGNRLLLRQRCTTLSPTTDAEEERVLAE